MKRIGAILLVAMLAANCAANRAAYATLGVTVHSVDFAMQVEGAWVVNNPCTVQVPATPASCASDAKRKQISDAFEKYQAARLAARDVLVASTDATPTPPEISAAAKAVIALVEQFTGKKVS